MPKEPSEHLNQLAGAVIGAAIEVHRILGPGFLERTYGDAMEIEMTLRGIKFSREHSISLNYKGHPIGEGKLDFLIDDELVIELKTVDKLAEIHKAQVISYLKATNRLLGLLINFMYPYFGTASSVSSIRATNVISASLRLCGSLAFDHPVRFGLNDLS